MLGFASLYRGIVPGEFSIAPPLLLAEFVVLLFELIFLFVPYMNNIAYLFQATKKEAR